MFKFISRIAAYWLEHQTVMTSADLEQVRILLALALQLPTDQRNEFLEKNCGTDSALRFEVEDLLTLSSAAAQFLNTPFPEIIGAQAEHRETMPMGEVLKDRYQITEVLAEGGFATVYKASDGLLAGKPVVVKVLDQKQGHEIFRRALDAELQSLGRLNHPNVVGIHDVGALDDGVPFLVLAYVPGVTLRELISKAPMSRKRVIKIIRGIAQALAAAHKLDILHLDIKPENIIVSDAGTPEERITVIDFGIAQLKVLPGQHQLAGSFRYMAPEQEEEPTAKCDIFSLGLIAFELFSGRLPKRDKSIVGQLPYLVPRAEANAISRALDQDVTKRSGTVGEFLEQFGSGSSDHQTRFFYVAACLALIVLLGTMLSIKRPTVTVSSKPVPFVTSEGAKYRPSFSPDGEWLFYAAGTLNHMDIFKKGLSGGNPVQVTENPADDDQPQVSPSGTQLAFIRSFPNEFALVVKELTGGGGETELGRIFELSSVSWGADGRTLLTAGSQVPGQKPSIRAIDLRTHVWKDSIAPDPAALGDDSPTVSPAGDKVAFVRKWNQSSADLFVVDVDPFLQPRSRPRRITSRYERIESVQWTPDGRDLVYLAGPFESGSLWRVSENGGARSPILPDVSRFEAIAIPRHVWRLAYSLQLSDSNVWRLDLQSANSSSLRPVISGSYNDEEACLSPDKNLIAFSSGRSGEEQIWLSDADGGNPRKITAFTSPDAMSVIWSRDSKDLIISVRSRELGERVYRSPASGPPVLKELMQQAAATWLSHDGHLLYFCRRVNEQRQLWRTDYPNLKTMEQVVDGEARVGREAPDGKSIYFTRGTEKEGVWQQELPHGAARRIVDEIYRRNLFAPGKNGLFYIAGNQQPAGGSSLMFRNQRDGSVKCLRRFDREVFWGLDISGDERTILFSQFDINSADIMLVGNFH